MSVPITSLHPFARFSTSEKQSKWQTQVFPILLLGCCCFGSGDPGCKSERLPRNSDRSLHKGLMLESFSGYHRHSQHQFIGAHKWHCMNLQEETIAEMPSESVKCAHSTVSSLKKNR
ncbi:unnamed protein product [Durusdinium trenchii]|uniref:Uncharacterized protein n=1 Tax=Durusdinium trenchii TaxID=1381693 RepID=A0ABP0IWE9_9DINO